MQWTFLTSGSNGEEQVSGGSCDGKNVDETLKGRLFPTEEAQCFAFL